MYRFFQRRRRNSQNIEYTYHWNESKPKPHYNWVNWLVCISIDIVAIVWKQKKQFNNMKIWCGGDLFRFADLYCCSPLSRIHWMQATAASAAASVAYYDFFYDQLWCYTFEMHKVKRRVTEPFTWESRKNLGFSKKRNIQHITLNVYSWSGDHLWSLLRIFGKFFSLFLDG